MGPEDTDEPGPGHEHAPGSGDPAGPEPASSGPEGASDVPDAGREPAGGARDAGDGAPDAAGTAPADADAAGSPPGDTAASPATPPGAALAAPVELGHRPSRKKKILAWTAGGVAVVVLLALGGAYAVYRHLNGNIHQVNISGELGSQPVDTHPQAENIMVIGSDTRNGQGPGFGQNLNTDQSDTLMILHLAADRKWVNVMSIPR